MRNRIRTAVRVVVLAAIAVTLLPKGLLADNDDVAIRGIFTVSYMRPSTPDNCGPGGGISIEAQGIGSISRLGPMFLTVKKCYTPATRIYAGTFTLRAANGDTLTGTYAGTQNAPDPSGFGPFQGTLTVTGGTGSFRHATKGVLSFQAVASPASLSATSGLVNGTAYYLVQGNMESADKH
jgi:hypothetical protein